MIREKYKSEIPALNSTFYIHITLRKTVIHVSPMGKLPISMYIQSICLLFYNVVWTIIVCTLCTYKSRLPQSFPTCSMSTCTVTSVHKIIHTSIYCTVLIKSINQNCTKFWCNISKTAISILPLPTNGTLYPITDCLYTPYNINLLLVVDL